jgi:hypothetical protein
MNTLERETKDIQVATRQTAKELSDHVSYDLSPSEHVWNALEEAVNDTAPPQETPATVGASEVSGAELTGETAAVSPSETTETPTEANPEVAGLEGTVPRGASQPQAEESEPEKPVNS